MARRFNWMFQATDAKPIRVRIPVYTDRWMMGDRYGKVIATSIKGVGESGSLYLVELDKSGKAIACRVDDCLEV